MAVFRCVLSSLTAEAWAEKRASTQASQWPMLPCLVRAKVGSAKFRAKV